MAGSPLRGRTCRKGLGLKWGRERSKGGSFCETILPEFQTPSPILLPMYKCHFPPLNSLQNPIVWPSRSLCKTQMFCMKSWQLHADFSFLHPFLHPQPLGKSHSSCTITKNSIVITLQGDDIFPLNPPFLPFSSFSHYRFWRAKRRWEMVLQRLDFCVPEMKKATIG